MNRNDVYKLIDGERDYQESKWDGSKHTPAEWIVYMENYLNEAKHFLSREADSIAIPKAMEIIRKVTAMGVAAMEQIDTNPRVIQYEIGDLFIEDKSKFLNVLEKNNIYQLMINNKMQQDLIITKITDKDKWNKFTNLISSGIENDNIFISELPTFLFKNKPSFVGLMLCSEDKVVDIFSNNECYTILYSLTHMISEDKFLIRYVQIPKHKIV